MRGSTDKQPVLRGKTLASRYWMSTVSGVPLVYDFTLDGLLAQRWVVDVAEITPCQGAACYELGCIGNTSSWLLERSASKGSIRGAYSEVGHKRSGL